jgi:hypothetical protein
MTNGSNGNRAALAASFLAGVAVSAALCALKSDRRKKKERENGACVCRKFNCLRHVTVTLYSYISALIYLSPQPELQWKEMIFLSFTEMFRN